MTPSYFSGIKRCTPHLSIPGLMETPQRYHIDNKNSRRALKLAVACNAVGGMFIKEITGTCYPGYTAEKTYTCKGKEAKTATSMVAPEYLDFIKDAVEFYSKKPGFRRKAGSMLLIHDKSRIHTSKEAVQGLKELGLDVMVQPARSPDLMPLDFGIFGHAKQLLDRDVLRHAPWLDRVQRFKDILSTCSPKETIGQFKLRLEGIIEAKGRHIENALKELKKR